MKRRHRPVAPRRRFYPRYDDHRRCFLIPIRVAPELLEQLRDGVAASALHLEPHADQTFDLVVEAPDHDEPIGTRQNGAYHGKCTELGRLRGVDAHDVKAEVLAAASSQFGREITSSTELSYREASWVLDRLDTEIAERRRTLADTQETV